jgi:replicative DNA helicase
MRHLTYDEPEGISMRRPGMGIDTAILNMAKNIEVVALK